MVLPILLYTCVNDEPIVPLIGQLLQIRRYRKFDSPMSYHQKLIQKHGNMDQSIDLPILFNTVTLSIIILTAFGSDFETDVNVKYVMRQVFADVFDAILYRSMYIINLLPLLPKLPFWKKKVIDNGTRMITDLSNGPDLLDLLLSAVDNEGKPFTDQQIKEQALTFVLAGSETTANLMTWIFYVLMTHDDVFEACREEVDRVLPNGIEPTNENISDLVICEAIINETLRLYPPAPIFTRYCIREHTIGSEHKICIPVGGTIIVNNYILHRRNDLWSRSDQFDYTRWMRDPKTGLKPKLPHPFAYLPFAIGPRNCIGQNFALLEAKIILVMFIQRCNFEIIPGQKIVPDFTLTMRAKYGLLAKISRRHISMNL
ncbi:unnamed protein product [Rotaria sp. Silwood1]|nr:unnamed protein product [Rotaria sp. Silwood1]CAF4850418.1 unnamed protein product [Rotaria sp. Silwood1]